MKSRTKPPQRYVYVIGPTAGLQKVGLATAPRLRLAALQTACPFDLVIHAAVAVPFAEAHAVERRAHQMLAQSCERNEWFRTTPALAVSAVEAAARDKGHAGEAVAGAGVLPLFAYSRAALPHATPAPARTKPWRSLRRAYQRVVERL